MALKKKNRNQVGNVIFWHDLTEDEKSQIRKSEAVKREADQAARKGEYCWNMNDDSCNKYRVYTV